MLAWLVPSVEFAALVPAANGRGRRVFAASMKPETTDRWRRWRLDPAELAPRVLGRLAELDGPVPCSERVQHERGPFQPVSGGRGGGQLGEHGPGLAGRVGGVCPQLGVGLVGHAVQGAPVRPG